MSRLPFRFKQFVIEQDQCAMKVGTDGVLLGAWANVEDATSILDVGTGTGLIAIMCAQRNPVADIVGLELEPAAKRQAENNAQASPWNERITMHLGDFTENNWSKPHSLPTFDHILCNPPFFQNAKLSLDSARNLARHMNTLDLPRLAQGSAQHLSVHGRVSLIIPANQEESAIQAFQQHGLFNTRKTYVKGNRNSPVKRVLIEFQRMETPVSINEICIEISRHNYTPEYVALTKAFYLKMA